MVTKQKKISCNSDGKIIHVTIKINNFDGNLEMLMVEFIIKLIIFIFVVKSDNSSKTIRMVFVYLYHLFY